MSNTSHPGRWLAFRRAIRYRGYPNNCNRFARMAQPLGASRAEWEHFAYTLGLGADLLPCVSNTSAVIAATSKLDPVNLGKVPSQYNHAREVVGLAKWTERRATKEDVAKWAREPDYGICLQTRILRAIDVDVDDPAEAQAIRGLLGPLAVAIRHRTHSPRFLALVRVDGGPSGLWGKPVVKTSHGAVEFLGDGQQCVVAGQHKSGDRYTWEGGLPLEIPTLSAVEWAALVERVALIFGVDASGSRDTRGARSRTEQLQKAMDSDPLAAHLYDRGFVKSAGTGVLHIECPFASEHTTEGGETSTSYFVRFTNGYERGHFVCLHAHCADRTDTEFRQAVGYESADSAPLLTFAPIEDEPGLAVPAPGQAPPADSASTAQGAVIPAGLIATAPAPARFAVAPVPVFLTAAPMRWVIKGVLPAEGLGVIYGPPASGKTFFTLDMVSAVAQGHRWRGRRTAPGQRVVYLCAEGVAGFRQRLRAYMLRHDLTDLPNFGVITDTLNLLHREDVAGVARAVGRADLIVVDTLAAVFGGDENNAEHMGKAVRHCQALARTTGAAVVLVHHTPKAGGGARGHSSLKGATDLEIEVSQLLDGSRGALVTKCKDGDAQGDDYGFDLARVLLGKDEEGDDVTSCAVIETAAPDRTTKKVSKSGRVERAEEPAGYIGDVGDGIH